MCASIAALSKAKQSKAIPASKMKARLALLAKKKVRCLRPIWKARHLEEDGEGGTADESGYSYEEFQVYQNPQEAARVLGLSFREVVLACNESRDGFSDSSSVENDRPGRRERPSRLGRRPKKANEPASDVPDRTTDRATDWTADRTAAGTAKRMAGGETGRANALEERLRARCTARIVKASSGETQKVALRAAFLAWFSSHVLFTRRRLRDKLDVLWIRLAHSFWRAKAAAGLALAFERWKQLLQRRTGPVPISAGAFREFRPPPGLSLEPPLPAGIEGVVENWKRQRNGCFAFQ